MCMTSDGPFNLPNRKFTIEYGQRCGPSRPPYRYQQRRVQYGYEQQQKHIDAHENNGRIFPADREALSQVERKACARIRAIIMGTVSPMDN